MLMNFASNLGSTVAAIIGVRDPAVVCAGLGAAGPADELVEVVDSKSNLCFLTLKALVSLITTPQVAALTGAP